MAEVAAIVFIVALVAVAVFLILYAVQMFRWDSRPISSETTDSLSRYKPMSANAGSSSTVPYSLLHPGEEYVDEEGNAFSETVSQSVETPRHVAAVDRLVDEVERDLRENPGAWKAVARTVILGSTYGHWERSTADVAWELNGEWIPGVGRIIRLFVNDCRVSLARSHEKRLSAALESGPIALARETKEAEEADLFNHAAEALAEAPSEIIAKSDVVVRKPGDRPRIATLTCNSNGIWSGVWKFGEGVVGDDFTIKTPRKSPRKASKKTAPTK